MSEETIKVLTQPSFDKLHAMFDLAWECNKSDETRTSLSRMVTDYITHVMQDYSWLIGIVENISEDRLCELAAAEREGRVVIVPKCEECRFNGKGKYADRCFFEDECIGRSCYNSFAPIETEAVEAALAGKGETNE